MTSSPRRNTTVSSAQASDACVVSCARSVTHNGALPRVLVASLASGRRGRDLAVPAAEPRS